MSATHDVTRLLAEWAGGNRQALDDLTPMVYRELRQLAASNLRKERQGHTLQPTALVHEAYLRLVDQKNPNWQSRSHFFGVAARLMRQILVDHARKKAGGQAGRAKSIPGRGRELSATNGAETWSLSTVASARLRNSTRGNVRPSNCAISPGSPWMRSPRRWMFLRSPCGAT